MPDIPEEVTRVETSNNEIPHEVAELPQETENLETRPYVISFENYKDRCCEVSLLNSNKAKKAIETLKIVGTKIKSRADFQKNHVDQIPVKRKGDYLKLYNGLSADIQIKEIKLQQDARIFFFDLEPERTFYVVAITENHYETEQIRR